jgi:uncharacterized delta-60 repeat protein
VPYYYIVTAVNSSGESVASAQVSATPTKCPLGQNGAQVVWKKVWDGGSYDFSHGIAVDSSGNVFVTGWSDNGRDDDYLTIKYNSSGDTVWQKRYDNGNYDYSNGIALDSSGNVLVTGTSWNGGETCDFLTIKYNSSGDTVWQKRYDYGKYDRSHGIAVDSSGNVYVTGYCYSGKSNDYYRTIIIKYNSSGDIVWDLAYDGGGLDYSNGIAVDSSGNVYVAGHYFDGTDYIRLIMKLNSSGGGARQKLENGDNFDFRIGIAVDSLGNVYVTGYSGTTKYNSNGDSVWQKADNGGDGIAVDSNDNVYVKSSIITKRNSSGDIVWREVVNDFGHAIAVDSSCNVYVAGQTNQNSPDYLTTKYRQY